MSKTIIVDPVTRLEGHLAIRLEASDGKVSKAYCAGEMFRGFETILRGRDPLDAQHITQRICGVCPVGHGTAAILAQDMAYHVSPPNNGRIARNLMLGANYLQSHIVHFYLLAALDFIDVKAILSYEGKDSQLLSIKKWVTDQVASRAAFPAAPLLPHYDGNFVKDSDFNLRALKHYVQALKMRTLAHQMVALFGGKVPHIATLVPGGITQTISVPRIEQYKRRLAELSTFVNEVYLPDVLEVATAFPEYFELGRGQDAFMAYGVFPQGNDNSKHFLPRGVILNDKDASFDVQAITEVAGQSSFLETTASLHPYKGQTSPTPDKQGAYSWLKAPRYNGTPMEVGPTARLLVAYNQNVPEVRALLDQTVAAIGRPLRDLATVNGRHLARALEAKLLCEQLAIWANQLVPGEPVTTQFTVPQETEGYGLTEAARGALGHWMVIKDQKIANYQCVVPTTWNCSPRDEKGIPGPVEKALEGTPLEDEKNPLEAVRVVRSFDPCLACAVH